MAKTVAGKARQKFAGPGRTTRAVAGSAPPDRRVLASLLVAWAALIVVGIVRQGGKSTLTPGQKRGSVVAMVVAVLLISLVGEVAPGFAVGFAGLLVVATLLAGPDVLGFLTHTLPGRLIGAAGAAGASAAKPSNPTAGVPHGA